jgi:hypothetical protein
LTSNRLTEDIYPNKEKQMYDDEFVGSPEVRELKAKVENTWAGSPEVAAMPREFEGVGGLLAGMVLGGDTGEVWGPRGENGDYYVLAAEEEDGDFEAVMMFFAGKFAMGMMCGTGAGDYPLSAFGIRLAASIAREFLGNFDEIARLARKLKADGTLCIDNVDAWKRSSEGGVSASVDMRAGVPQANGAGAGGVGTHCESRGGEPSK